MEERIIDEEIGRKIKVKKLQDGEQDVVDELAEGEENETVEGEEGDEELTFEIPDLEEDDEDLACLSPEEAAALRQKKKEEAEARKAEYQSTVAAGMAFLEEGSYHAAELQFEKALLLDDVATEASVGYWRAKTEDFSNPDALMDEYAKEYPHYAFEKNKGYGTKAHIDGIKEHGLCPIHRRTFTKKF